MSLEIGSTHAIQIKCSYMIEKYKKKLKKLKRLKREMKSFFEKKRMENYIDRYFINKEREHLHCELAKEKEKIHLEHLEKLKEIYNNYFADIFLYEQEYYQCIYKVFKNLLLKKEEIDEKEKREQVYMMFSDKNINTYTIWENKTEHANNNFLIDNEKQTEHGEDKKNFDIENLCQLNINEIYQSIILNQSEKTHTHNDEGDYISNTIRCKIKNEENPPITLFSDEQSKVSSELCINLSKKEKSDHEMEDNEKNITDKGNMICVLSPHGKKATAVEEALEEVATDTGNGMIQDVCNEMIKEVYNETIEEVETSGDVLENAFELKDNSDYEEEIQTNTPTSGEKIKQENWHTEDVKHAYLNVEEENYNHNKDYLGREKSSNKCEDEKEKIHSKSKEAKYCDQMFEKSETENDRNNVFIDEQDEIKCSRNMDTLEGERNTPRNPCILNHNDEYINNENLKSVEYIYTNAGDEKCPSNDIDEDVLHEQIRKVVANSNICETSQMEDEQKGTEEFDDVIENNINFNISSYFSGSYDDINDSGELGKIDENIVPLNNDTFYNDIDNPEYGMIEEHSSVVNSTELINDLKKNHDQIEIQNGEESTIFSTGEDSHVEKELHNEVVDAMSKEQNDLVKSVETNSKGDKALALTLTPINENMRNSDEYMKEFNEENQKIHSSKHSTLYSYHNEYFIPIEKMQTFENYAEKISRLENYENMLHFINSGDATQRGNASHSSRTDDAKQNGVTASTINQPVHNKPNVNLELNRVEELINYMSAKKNEIAKNGFKKKKKDIK
ncbi:hypothetical protein, conserved [Plasmodium gonderi]|uniref:Uncharacterized protein n=1 Tax=Plasmodium gonderi TaxID=77519 RepID=A0A1Y1JPP1_PLAGO|nr:hypothetical protein, conserved [Plasmodium gonderi]GAW82802.1 hypothetical protein, conserved [Plasmodium gonderi]